MIRFPNRFHASVTPFGNEPVVDHSEMEARSAVREVERKARENARGPKDAKVFDFLPLLRALG